MLKISILDITLKLINLRLRSNSPNGQTDSIFRSSRFIKVIHQCIYNPYDIWYDYLILTFHLWMASLGSNSAMEGVSILTTMRSSSVWVFILPLLQVLRSFICEKARSHGTDVGCKLRRRWMTLITFAQLLLAIPPQYLITSGHVICSILSLNLENRIMIWIFKQAIFSFRVILVSDGWDIA